MSVPFLGFAIKGWTRKTTVELVTKSVINFLVTENRTEIVLDCNFQPLPAWKVNRKPDEQRTWLWWSIIVKQGPNLKTDDVIVKDGIEFRIDSGNNWSESGFTKYEAVQGFQDPST